MKHTILFPALILVLFALGGTGLITITDWLTQEQRHLEKQRTLQQLLQSVTPNNSKIDDTTRSYAFNPPVSGIQRIHQLNAADTLLGYALEVLSTQGYNGDILLLVGLDPNFHISQVRVIHHRETPGLGDRIEVAKSNWLMGFNDLSATADQQQWTLRRQHGRFDHLTGATITAKAVLNTIYQSLVYLREHPELLKTEIR